MTCRRHWLRPRHCSKPNPETVLFEPAFQHGGVLVRADILSPFRGTVRVGGSEVIDQGIKDYHYNDAAIQYWVVTGAGIPVNSVSISHINNQFVYSGGWRLSRLFKQVNVTEEILPLVEQVPAWVEEFQKGSRG